jgi:outer membrane protein TolC
LIRQNYPKHSYKKYYKQYYHKLTLGSFILLTLCAWQAFGEPIGKSTLKHPLKSNSSINITSTKPTTLTKSISYNGSNEKNEETDADKRLKNAIANPEYMLTHWLELPSSAPINRNKVLHLTLREAILLALRYNPNIKNTELDRIIQRYQLRLAYNEFELRYALQGSAAFERTHFSGIGTTNDHSYLATPEVNLKTKAGTSVRLNLENNVSTYDPFSPIINLEITQPLLRGFGKKVNEAPLLDAIDSENLNKINLIQAVCDQVTQVIAAYRSLILSGNNLENQQRQLEEAKKTYAINKKKIKAGQLEPTANIQQAYQIESLNLLVEQVQNDFNIATQNLLETIGLQPDMHLAVPSDIKVDKIIIPNLNESINLGLKHNAQYIAALTVLSADKRAYELAKNAQLWRLDLTTRMQSGAVTDVNGGVGGGAIAGIYNGQNLTGSAQVMLTVPIRDLTQRSQLINAKVKLEKDKLTLIALKRALITTITNTINNIKSLAKRYVLAEKQVKLAQQSYSLEKKKQQAGISSALDVSNTQNQLIQAQAGLISAKIAYLNQLSDLQRLLGTTLDEWQIKLRYD